jgi:hypothetical protein
MESSGSSFSTMRTGIKRKREPRTSLDEIDDLESVDSVQIDDPEDNSAIDRRIESFDELHGDGDDSSDDSSDASTSDVQSSADHLVDETSEDKPAVHEFASRSHPQGGWVLDSPEALNKWKEFGKEMKWFEECPSRNPYYPWKHEGELWLSDFLYRQTHVSMEQSDELL